MVIKIKADAYLRHRFPNWPWYLGYYMKAEWWHEPKYMPGKFESMKFEVYENEYWPDKWTLSDEEWAKANVGNKVAWIDKEDADIIDP